jgi:hypothetical protein
MQVLIAEVSSMNGHTYTKRQREVMKRLAFNPSLCCDVTIVTGSDKKTYAALMEAGAILLDSNNRYHLTAHGRAMAERFLSDSLRRNRAESLRTRRNPGVAATGASGGQM